MVGIFISEIVRLMEIILFRETDPGYARKVSLTAFPLHPPIGETII